MSKTPRTDKAEFFIESKYEKDGLVYADFARGIEREINRQWMSIWECPHDENVLMRRIDGNVYQDFIYDESTQEYVDKSKKVFDGGGEVSHYMPIPVLLEGGRDE